MSISHEWQLVLATSWELSSRCQKSRSPTWGALHVDAWASFQHGNKVSRRGIVRVRKQRLPVLLRYELKSPRKSLLSLLCQSQSQASSDSRGNEGRNLGGCLCNLSTTTWNMPLRSILGMSVHKYVKNWAKFYTSKQPSKVTLLRLTVKWKDTSISFA